MKKRSEEYVARVVAKWVGETARQAEVGDLDIVLLVDEDVLAFSMSGQSLPAA